MLDGFRAVAVLGVIAGHAMAYRYVDPIAQAGPLRHVLNLASPLAETGVYLFFAISGYIITSLMLREEGREGQFSLAAFYVRRSLRIIPPFAAFLATVALLAAGGLIQFDPTGVLPAIAFTCNTGLTQCGWFVAHSWSLAVEEQYYLIWPLLFTLIAAAIRPRFAASVTALLIALFVILPWDWHSNSISFACIAAGATCALFPQLREMLERAGGYWTWLLAAGFVLIGPHFLGLQPVEALMPGLAVFLLFGGRSVPLLRRILESRPMQFIGGMSYSLYLWQQLFLASLASYVMPPPPVWLLPIVAWLSLKLIEQPCMTLSHQLSRRIIARRSPLAAAVSEPSLLP